MIENIELTELNVPVDNAGDKKGDIFTAKDLALCGHLKTSAEVVLAEVNISIENLLSLKKGSVISTEQSVDSLMTLMLNGKAVALGRLVVSDNYFGFEVAEVKVG